jgi:hypothetical protein
LHVPFLFNRDLLYLLIGSLDPENNKQCPLIRSFYGNINKVGGDLFRDVKNVKDFEARTYLSTTERSFISQPIGRYIRSKA